MKKLTSSEKFGKVQKSSEMLDRFRKVQKSRNSSEKFSKKLESKPRNPKPGNTNQESKTRNPNPGIQNKESKSRNPKSKFLKQPPSQGHAGVIFYNDDYIRFGPAWGVNILACDQNRTFAVEAHRSGLFLASDSRYKILDGAMVQKLSFRQKLDFWVTNLS